MVTLFVAMYVGRPQEVAATLLDLTLSSPITTTPSKALSRHGKDLLHVTSPLSCICIVL